MGDYVVGAKFKADANEARTLLAEAGYPGGAGFPKLDVIFNTSEVYGALAEADCNSCGSANSASRPTCTTWNGRFISTRCTTGTTRWRASAGRRSCSIRTISLEQFQSNSSNNWTGWSSPEYDLILAESERTASNAERANLLPQLDEIISREMPIIPIYHNTHRSLVHPAVKGWPNNAINIKIFQQTYLEAK